MLNAGRVVEPAITRGASAQDVPINLGKHHRLAYAVTKTYGPVADLRVVVNDPPEQ